MSVLNKRTMGHHPPLLRLLVIVSPALTSLIVAALNLGTRALSQSAQALTSLGGVQQVAQLPTKPEQAIAVLSY